MTDTQRGFDWFGKSPTDVEVALHLELDAKEPAALAQYLKSVDAELHKAGFKRSDRLEPRGFGGGGGGRPGVARPEEAPPAELEIPAHCEQPMVYKPPREAQGDRKAVAARWECRKGRDCATPEERGGNKYPATNWHMTKKKPPPAAKAESAKPAAEKPPANGTEPVDREMTAKEKVDFWAKTREWNYTRPQVFEIAADVLNGQGPALKDTEFAKLGHHTVHRVFTRLKEIHAAK